MGKDLQYRNHNWYPSLTLLPQFSLDEIDNEITLQAFKLLVEDLLVLFQAVNEGVINILGGLLFVLLMHTGSSCLTPLLH